VFVFFCLAFTVHFFLSLSCFVFFLIFLYSQTKWRNQKELRIIVNLTEFTSLALRFIFYSVRLHLWWIQLILLLTASFAITWEIISVDFLNFPPSIQLENVEMLLKLNFIHDDISSSSVAGFENNFHLFWNSNSLFVFSLKKAKKEWKKRKKKIHFHVDSNKVCECLTYYLLMFIIFLPEKISLLPNSYNILIYSVWFWGWVKATVYLTLHLTTGISISYSCCSFSYNPRTFLYRCLLFKFISCSVCLLYLHRVLLPDIFLLTTTTNITFSLFYFACLANSKHDRKWEMRSYK
jgi:hypothetical protein